MMPMLAMMELGQLLFATSRGVLSQKLRSYGYFLNLRNWPGVVRRRWEAQRRRRIGDREFLRDYDGAIEFPKLTYGLLRYVANPIMKAYWAVARRLIMW